MDISQLKKAIYSHLMKTGSFKTALKGGLHYVENNSATILFPYCTYSIVSSNVNRDSASKFDDITIQFTIIDNSSSSNTVSATGTLLNELLDDSQGSFPVLDDYIVYGIERLRTPRESKESDEWSWSSDYIFQLQTK